MLQAIDTAKNRGMLAKCRRFHQTKSPSPRSVKSKFLSVSVSVNSYTDTAHSEQPCGFFRIDVRLKPLPQPPTLFDVDHSTWADAISQPGANDIWQYGTSKSVVWNNSLLHGSTVTIYVLHDSPTGLADTNPEPKIVLRKSWFRFASNVPNSGIHTTDPSTLSGNGNAYKILEVSNDGYWDMSQGLFILQP